MMLRKYGLVAGCSLLSAIVAVGLYRMLEKPREIIVRETVPARYAESYPLNDGLTQAGETVFSSAAPTNFMEAAMKSTPAVVNIKTIQGSGSFSFLRGGPVTASSGSGVIVAPEGYIVTNNHVVENSDEIFVTFHDRREVPAKLIGTDPSTDLAVLKVDMRNLVSIAFGNSDSLQVGEWVLAVGNPFNLESTVTAGIVSAKGRSIDILDGQDRIESFIQTDAAVNPGNSGGALVNTRGELIGINTAIITRSGRYEGYSFAVPSNLVRKVIRDLKDYGIVQRGLLGVFIDELNSESARSLGLKSVEGVRVTRITPGSGADDAGLRKNDVIISINNVKVRTLPEMQEQVGRFRPGNVLKIEYLRNNKRQIARVTLKNKNNSTDLVRAGESDYLRDLGFELRNLSRQEISRYKVQGVRVSSIVRGSRIDATNLRPGFIITKVDDIPVSNVAQVLDALRETSGRVMLTGVYEEKGDEYYYIFKAD